MADPQRPVPHPNSKRRQNLQRWLAMEMRRGDRGTSATTSSNPQTPSDQHQGLDSSQQSSYFKWMGRTNEEVVKQMGQKAKRGECLVRGVYSGTDLCAATLWNQMQWRRRRATSGGYETPVFDAKSTNTCWLTLR
ncbi:hypothetical protein MIND_00304700 [Mycena indigotica]|uniref:Uncharacterized protein n=1 Tax=Mycena indigotica TaxID=2126181 RepID=A0A8H6T321_9AGAR|nr:uncharacterized protein MIND_00304700 [Mycena indigotica]KAF7309341.1 hypothetical protein MIND_00304700 [Mycena indigotica]